MEHLLNKKYRYVGCSSDFCDDAWIITEHEVLYYDLEVCTWYILKVSSSMRILCELEITEEEVQGYV